MLRQVAESGGVHLLAADIRADSANLEPFLQGGALAHAPVGLVLGSEGQGLSEAALMVLSESVLNGANAVILHRVPISQNLRVLPCCIF